MAGAGYKLFNTGDVLTAAQVNTYLQEQAVMRFATVAARTTALSGVLAEGMVSYIDATDTLEYYNGSTWLAVNTTAGDITGVTAGTGISGGGTSGDVTITNSMATAIDAKGDLIAGTADNTFSRLAIGSNGETLVADSSATTGLRWQSGFIGNPVINGAFDIAQRGTSVAVSASTNANTLDRFQLSVGANGASTVSQQSVGDTTNLPTIRYCARVQRNSGQTGTTTMYFATSMETATSIPFAGQTVVVSFYARAGANYSSASSALGVTLRSGTGTDQNIYSYTGGASPIDTTSTLTTTWQRFTATGTVSASATELAIYFYYTPSGTAGANDYFEVTGIQLELGSVATTFKRAGGTLAGELAACQRYYARNETATGFTALSGWGMATATTSIGVNWELSVPMRIAPVVLEYGNLRATDTVGVASNISTLVLDGTTPTTINLSASGLSGFTQYRPAIIQNRSSGTGYIAVSAEL